MSGVSERGIRAVIAKHPGGCVSPIEATHLLALLDAERDRVRVLAAAIPQIPWRADRCYACAEPRDRGVHDSGCTWPAAHTIKESLSHE